MCKKIHSRRQQILQVAIEVFGKDNFQSVYISKIAQKANIAEGTINQYFKSKEDIFFSILGQKTEEFCEEFNTQIQGIHDALNKLKKFTWLYLYHFKTNPAYARTLMLEANVCRNFTKSETFNGVKVITDRVLQFIREGQEEGVIRKDIDGHVIRELLFGILDYRVTRSLSDFSDVM